MALALYRLLLLLCPADFRQEYGAEMLRLFRDRCRSEGTWGVSFEALPDLLMTAVREHMDTFRQDLLYTFRTLAKNPGFAVVAFLTLALAIGANTAIFSVVNGVVLKPLPFAEPGRLVQLYEKRPQQGRVRNAVSYPDYADWQKQSTAFTGMAAATGYAYNLTRRNETEVIRAAIVTANFFQVLGVQPELGRDFRAGEDEHGQATVAVLNHSLWVRRFGEDPKIVGQSILLNGRPFNVVGVVPDLPRFPEGAAEIWTPLGLPAEQLAARGGHFLSVFGRLKPGVSLAQARSEMDAIARRLEQQYADVNSGHGVNVFPLHEEVTSRVRPALLVLMGAVGLVLLIACANIANLSLVRTSQRRREISIRTALGAGSGRVVRQLLTESVVLSVAGGAAGLLLAYFGVAALARINPGNFPRMETVRVDSQVLLLTLALSMLTGVMFGAAPALYAAKSKPGDVLKDGARGSAGQIAGQRARDVLVVAEVALALTLSIGAGLMIQSFVRLAQVNPGFDPTRLLSANLFLFGPKYEDNPNRTAAYYSDLVGKVRALPGVVSAGATTAMPLTGQDAGRSFIIEGRPPVLVAQRPIGRYHVVTPGYFSTMRIPVLAGRAIGEQDTDKSVKVAMANDTLVRTYFPNENAIGQRISFGPLQQRTGTVTEWYEIVGVVADVKHYALDGEIRPVLYFAHTQRPEDSMTVVLRTTGAPEQLANAVRGAVQETGKTAAMAGMIPVEQMVSASLAQPRTFSVILAVFSTAALILAALGIYGVMSFTVGQRAHEIGVRMALGAQGPNVRGLVLRRALTLAIAGILLGVASSLALARMMEKLLFGIAPTDPVTFLGTSALLVGVAAAACYLPARRATRVDPIVALRCD
jgi:predicted permease